MPALPSNYTRVHALHRLKRMIGVFATTLLVFLLEPMGRAAEQLQLGTVHFEATGAAEAQPHFQRGVAALHSFWYEEALESFQRAVAVDPTFAMAWWGIAMTYHRPYLPGSDDAAGSRALAQIGDTTRLSRREVKYIQALRTYFSDRPAAERTLAYAGAMQELHREYPDDSEAAVFFALSLLGYAWATDEGVERQERAAAVAREIYRRNPRHPGALHYIIHSFDEPKLAARALDAATQYARVAPGAPHALHMPSHIFLQLGRWAEVAAANERAWAASENWVKQKQLSGANRDYHNLHWLIYACLQQGRYAKARDLVVAFRGMRNDIPMESRHFLHDAISEYIVETREWNQADELFGDLSPPVAAEIGRTRVPELCGVTRQEYSPPPSGEANVPMFIRALAAAARGASDAAERSAALRKAATVNEVMAKFWQVRTLAVAGLLRARKGEQEAAAADLKAAAAIEEVFAPPPGPPSAIKPPRELLGEILLSAGRPSEALVQFRDALARHPNRALSVLGRARAEAATLQPAAAASTYQHFLDQWQDADRDRPELAEARDFVARYKAKGALDSESFGGGEPIANTIERKPLIYSNGR